MYATLWVPSCIEMLADMEAYYFRKDDNFCILKWLKDLFTIYCMTPTKVSTLMPSFDKPTIIQKSRKIISKYFIIIIFSMTF